MVKTQKADGIAHLIHIAYSLGAGIYAPPSATFTAAQLANAPENPDGIMDTLHRVVEHALSRFGKHWFIRPCPMRPRHGFVDSRRLDYQNDEQAMKELRAIAQETLAADPEGEIVIMGFLDAHCNAIITPSSVTLGPKHDGATAGRASITLNIKSPMLDVVLAHKDNRYGVGKHESPYLEFVDSVKANSPTITQLRAGPNVDVVDDYIPYSVKVGQVITVDPEQDLLEWETRTKEYTGVRNLVVHHPGGSINSHFGVHCVINKLPYITSFTPKIGDTLKRTAQSHWQPEDYQYLATLIRKYDAHDHEELFSTNRRKYAGFVLGALHAVGGLMQSRSEYSFRAVAAGMVAGARLFNAVSVGEVRHAPSNTVTDSPAREFYKLAGLSEMALSNCCERNSVYDLAMSDMSFMDSATNRVLGSYYCYSQPDWGDSYGGTAWAVCAASSFTFSRKLAQFVLDPTPERLKSTLNEFNKVVNLAHNNGWWLNKVIPHDEFTQYSRHPATGFINTIAYDLMTDPLDLTPVREPLYEKLLKRAAEFEAEYTAILKGMRNYVGGVEAAQSAPFPQA